MRSKAILLLWIKFIFACTAQYSDEIKKIIDLGYERKAQSILPYLSDKNEPKRYYATLQCVSLADTITIPFLKKNVLDSSIRVACTAAYALGQFSSDTQLNLMPLILQEKRDTVAYWLIISAGKYKTIDRSVFYQYLDTLQNSTRLEAALYALYYLGMQNIYDAKGISKALECLLHKRASVRYASAKYFERMPASYYTSSVQQRLFQQAQTEHDTYTKIALIHSLKKCLPNDSVQTYLNKICVEEKQEYRYVVAALRAGGIPLQKPAIQNENIQQEILNIILTQNLPNSDNYLTTFKASLANSIGTYEDIKSKFPYLASVILKYLGTSVRHHNFIASQMLNSENSPVIRTTAAELLLQLRQSGSYSTLQQDTNMFLQYCKQGLQSKDPGVIAVMAEMVRKYYLKNVDINTLQQAKSSLQLPRDIETYQEIEKTIALKQGKTYNPKKYPQNYYTKVAWSMITDLRPIVEVNTTKGTFCVELYADVAPATVSYMIKLIKEKYFEGRYFHRLVPNFLIQGGCPRGDGYGSTDLLLRSEFSPIPYQEGSVGMASAGKDTESCQFFITHVPTPHLNGRYTIFGKVISGMNVVHSLSIGDKILKTELKNK